MINIKYILMITAIVYMAYQELNAAHLQPTSFNSENIYIRIYSSTSGYINGGETITGEGDNWFQVIELSGGYYLQFDGNGLPTGQKNQYRTSVLMQQKDALTSLITNPLVQNHNLKVEIIIMQLDNMGATQVGFKYTLSDAQLQLLQHFNSSDFEVKTIRLDFVSGMVEQTDEVSATTSILSF